jgi:hypothetical protein
MLIQLMERTPTPAMADTIYTTILEFIRAHAPLGKTRLFWTNSENDWPDLVIAPLREIWREMCTSEPQEQYLYVRNLKIKLLNDVLAEEKIARVETNPSSLHYALLNRSESNTWNSFVNGVMRILSPNIGPRRDTKQQGTPKAEYASRKSKRRSAKSPIKSSQEEASETSGMDITGANDAVASDQLLSDWQKSRLQVDSINFACRVSSLELLENLFALIYPIHPNFVDGIVDSFSSIPTDAERIFFLNKFSGNSPSRLALIDRMLVQYFENNSTALQKRSNATTTVPSVKKMMGFYWDLRPIHMIKRPDDTSPKSNFIILSTLLLHALDALDFPIGFSAEDCNICITKAKLIHNQTLALAKVESVFYSEEIDQAIDCTRDLQDFVIACTPNA